MKLVIASDHAGFALKEEVRAYLAKAGHEMVDLGAYKVEPQDDYPDFAERVGEAIKRGRSAARHSHLRFGRGRLRGGQQDSRHSRRHVPRHLLRAPGRGARRHERDRAGRAHHRRLLWPTNLWMPFINAKFIIQRRTVYAPLQESAGHRSEVSVRRRLNKPGLTSMYALTRSIRRDGPRRRRTASADTSSRIHRHYLTLKGADVPLRRDSLRCGRSPADQWLGHIASARCRRTVSIWITRGFEARHHASRIEPGSAARSLSRPISTRPSSIEPRSFSHDEFFASMLRAVASCFPTAHWESSKELAASDKCMLGALNNEARETNEYRFETFGLRQVLQGGIQFLLSGIAQAGRGDLSGGRWIFWAGPRSGFCLSTTAPKMWPAPSAPE